MISVPLGDTKDVSTCWKGIFLNDPSELFVLFLLLFLLSCCKSNGLSVVSAVCIDPSVGWYIDCANGPLVKADRGINVVGSLNLGLSVLGRAGVVVRSAGNVLSGFIFLGIMNSWFLTKFKFLGKFP